MATSSKKITYTSDFKLKVLDYYFKNGGDEKFGLKKKTAGHFNIDKKTINRMLNNPDMVKRARKLLSKRVTGSAKGAGGVRPGGAKATTKGTKVNGLGSKAGGSKAGTSGNKYGTASTSGKVTSSSHISASDTSSSSYKAPTSSAMSTKHVGGNNSSQGSSTSIQTSTKSNSSKIKYMGRDVNSGVQVFDLPEDPDYSLLKHSINASTNGAANIARLLVTGTEEVRNIILNECDMILECKVCHNLFRSVVNFLAHKRIYCQEEFADVRTLFHKDDVQGITSHSSTVIVEPEPPPDKDPYPSTSSATETFTKPARTAMQGNSSRSGIDSIAAKLANRKKHSNVSHASHTGSSRYFERLDCVNSIRDKLSRDCSVVLEDIAGVTNARYQTYVSPTISAPTVSMNAIVDEVTKRSTGLTVAINEHGEIMKTAPGNVRTMDVEQPIVSSGLSKELVCRTCNTRFATQKTLSVHQRSHHGFERCIYCCPICKSTFLSMWAVVKHLQRYHKKTKNQTERLRKVIKKNVYKKMVYHSEDRHGEYREMDIYRKEEEKNQKENQNVGKEGMSLEENSTNNQSTKREIQGLQRSTVLTSPRKCSPTKSPLKGWRSKEGVRWMCNVCLKMFITRAASLAHVATHIICNFEPRAILVNVETGKHVRKNRRSSLGDFKSSLDTSDSESEMGEENEEQYDRYKVEQPEVEELKEIVIEEPSLKSGRKNRESVRRIVIESASETIGKCTEVSGNENYNNSVIREQSEIYSENNLKENPQDLKISISPVSSVEREMFEPLSSITSDIAKMTSKSDFKNRSKTSGSWDNLVSARGTSDIHENKSDSENSKEGSPVKKLTQFQLAAPTRVPVGNIHSPEDIDVDLESVLLSSLNFASIPYPECRFSDASPVKSCWESQSQEDVHKAASKLHLFEEDWSGSGTSSVASEQMDIDSEPEVEGSVGFESKDSLSEDCLTKVTTETGLLRSLISHENSTREKHISSLEVTSDEELKVVKSSASQLLYPTRELKKDKLISQETLKDVIFVDENLKTSKVLLDEVIVKEEIINQETRVKEEIKEEVCLTEVVNANITEECIKEEITIKEEKEITKELTEAYEKEKIKQSCQEELSDTQCSEDWIDHIALIDSTLAIHSENEKSGSEPRKNSSFSKSSDKAREYEIVVYSPLKKIKDEHLTVDHLGEKRESQSVHVDQDFSTQSVIHGKDFTKVEGTADSVNLPKYPLSVNCSKSSEHLISEASNLDKCAEDSVLCTESKPSTENVDQTGAYATTTIKLEKALDCELSSASITQPKSSVTSVSKLNTCAASTYKSEITGISDVLSKTLASVSQLRISSSCVTHPRTSPSFESKQTTALFVKSKGSASSASLSELSTCGTHSDILVESVTQSDSSAAFATELKASISPVSQLKLPQTSTASVREPITFIPIETCPKTKASLETVPEIIAEEARTTTTSVNEQDPSVATIAISKTTAATVTHPEISASVTYTEANTETEIPVLSDISSTFMSQSQNSVISSSVMGIKPSAPLSSLAHTYDSGITVTKPKTTMASTTQSKNLTSALTETKTGVSSLHHQKSTIATVAQPRTATTSDTQSRTTTVSVTQPRTTLISVTQPRTTTAVTEPKSTTASLTQLRTTTASETQPRTSIASLTQPRVTSASVTQPRIITTSVTQPRTTTVSVTPPKTTIAAVPQLRTTTVSVTQPRITTDSLTLPRTTSASVTQPKTTIVSMAQPRTTTASVTQPKTTIVSMAQLRTTTASVTQFRTSSAFLTKPRVTTSVTQSKISNNSVTQSITTSVEPRITTSLTQSRTTIASLTQPKSTTTSISQPRTVTTSVTQPISSTASVTQTTIITASETRPRINTTSVTQPRTTNTSVTRVRTTTTSVTQPRNTSASMTQTHSKTVPVTPDKIAISSVIQPKTVESVSTVENVMQPCISDVIIAQAKNNSDSTPKATHMPECRSKAPIGNLTNCNIVNSQVNQAEGLAGYIVETETTEKSLINLSNDEISDENITGSVAQNKSPSCSNINSKGLFDHTENIDNFLHQSKCIPDCCDQNIAHTCRVLSRNFQNPVTYSKDHTSHVEVSQEKVNKKERGELKEKSRQLDERRLTDYLETEVNKRLFSKKPEEDKANNMDVLEKSEFKGFNKSKDGIEDENDFRKMYSGITQNTTAVVMELEEPCDNQRSPFIVDEHNSQDSLKHSELESTQSTISLPDLCRINPSSSNVCLTKLGNKNCGTGSGEFCPKEAVGLDNIPGDSVVQQPLHTSKHLYMNSKKKNTVESGIAKKSSSNLYPFHFIRSDRSYSTDWKEKEIKLKIKSHDSTTAIEQSRSKKRDKESCEDAQRTKKRERESCEDAHINLVTEILGIDTNIVKKIRSTETPVAQKMLGIDETCNKDGENFDGRDGDALKFRYVTTPLEKQINSSCIENKVPEAEEDILQKVKDDWAQLSSDPQWKWRKREKNKELWKLVMAAKATVSSKKLSQKRDYNNKSVPDAHKCSTSTDMDENLKEPEPTETMENIDQEMSESKFTSLTSVQYLKGKKWNEGCILQKKKEITGELSGYALTDNKEETFVRSNNVDLSKAAVDENIALSSKRDTKQQKEDKVISMSCTESPHKLSSIQNKALDNMIILEDTSSPDPHITAVVDDGTTLDEAAVMRDPTTFGDLSYYYDLH